MPAPTELSAALAQFNQGAAATRDNDRHEKAVAKADRRRQDAAARMKTVLDADPSAEERDEAEAAYRTAVDEWKQLLSPTELDADVLEDPSPEDPSPEDPSPETP